MFHSSKYYNLDSVPHGWISEEFVYAVQTLESLKTRDLLKLFQQFEIVFSNAVPEKLDPEDMISALLDDVTKGELLDALKQLELSV